MEELRSFIRWCFATPRRALITLAVLAALLLMIFPGIFDRFWYEVGQPIVSLLLVIGVLVLILRFIFVGRKTKK